MFYNRGITPCQPGRCPASDTRRETGADTAALRQRATTERATKGDLHGAFPLRSRSRSASENFRFPRHLWRTRKACAFVCNVAG